MLTTKIFDPPYRCVSVKQHLSSSFQHIQKTTLHEHTHNVVSVLDDTAHFLTKVNKLPSRLKNDFFKKTSKNNFKCFVLFQFSGEINVLF